MTHDALIYISCISVYGILGLILFKGWSNIFFAILVLLVLFKLYLKFSTGICTSKVDLTGKTAIVTGANTGIGKETARDLAKRNARVILACRNTERGNLAADEIICSTGNKQVIVRKIDLSSLTSVRQFVENFKNEESRLDILINNAGMLAERGRKIIVEGLEEQFASNHFGHFLLTNLLLDLLKKSAPSRVVVLSSIAYKWGKIEFDNLNMEKRVDEPFTVYCNTKLANVLFTKELSHRLQGTGITVNCIHPGAVKTDIARKMNPLMYLLTLPFAFFIKNSLEGAQTSIYVAVSEHLTTVSGKYFADCQEVPLEPISEDEGLAKKLWEVSEKLTNL